MGASAGEGAKEVTQSFPAHTLQVAAITHKGLVRGRNEDALALDGWLVTGDANSPDRLLRGGTPA